MHSPRDFLLLECESVRHVLQETLRYEYGGEGSREFFEECEIRLDFIKSQIDCPPTGSNAELQTNAELLIELSNLIARIERSSMGEYSWPFVEELKEIAFAICTEATLKEPHSRPKVHVLSDGGLDKYMIYPEQKRPSAGQRRILTIIFPRSLKHFVLLHPVLGHELGHAIWRGSEHEKVLRTIVSDTLLRSNTKFKDVNATAAWLYDPGAPIDVQQFLASFDTSYGINQSNFFQSYAKWFAWVEEIACDLIGIATFGPSFVAALCELLNSLMPSGCGFSDAHPPSGCRINLMLQAVRLLGYDKMSFTDPLHQNSYDDFWKQLDSQRQGNSWFDLFTDQELFDTLTQIRHLLSLNPPALYDNPEPALLGKLIQELTNRIPPTNFEISVDGTPVTTKIDFRHILYAGWVAAQDASTTTFSDMNRLCEHAIMQQRAIKLYLAP